MIDSKRGTRGWRRAVERRRRAIFCRAALLLGSAGLAVRPAALGAVAISAFAPAAVVPAALAAAPAEPAPESPPSRASSSAVPAFKDSSFEHYCEIELPAEPEDAVWLSVALTPGVFNDAQPSLADLRLCVPGQPALPYVIRVLDQRRVDTVLDAKQFDRVQGGKGTVQLSLDLGENPPEHNELELDLPNVNYRRRVEVDAGDKPGDWKHLTAGNVIDFRAAGHELRDTRLSYSPSRFRYLRVTVHSDPQVDTKPVEIQAARVHYFLEQPGEMIESPAKVEPREAMPVMGQPGSRWAIQLAARNLPVESLLCDVLDQEFSRTYQLEAAEEIEGQTVYSGSVSDIWTRRLGEPAPPLSVGGRSFPLGRMRLLVVDYANPSLTITGVRTRGAVRELVFANGLGLRGPLRLYFGDPKADSPHYDLERRIPAKLDPAPLRLKLGDAQKNPAYTPPPVPLTERWPWTIYLVLAFSAVSLAAVLVNLGRRMIAASDANEAAPAPPAA